MGGKRRERGKREREREREGGGGKRRERGKRERGGGKRCHLLSDNCLPEVDSFGSEVVEDGNEGVRVSVDEDLQRCETEVSGREGRSDRCGQAG